MALALTRPQNPPRFFPGWTAYLQSWSDGAEATLCQALTKDYYPLIQGQVGPRLEELDDLETKWSGNDAIQQQKQRLEDEILRIRRTKLPWITPVIGSGCLTAEDSALADIRLVPNQLVEVATAEHWSPLPDGESKSAVLRSFGDALIASKVGPPTEKPARYTQHISVDRRTAARAALCAHLLSRLYFEVGALTAEPIASLTTPIMFDPTSRLFTEINELTLLPLRDALLDLEASATEDPEQGNVFVSVFARTVRHDLASDRPQVAGADARLMAEITWHLMTKGTTQYPGWTDLLVLLGLKFNLTEESDNTEDKRVKRDARLPYLKDLTTVWETLGIELERTTRLSWQSRLPDLNRNDAPATRPVSKRDELYDAISSVLVAQSGLSTPETTRDDDTGVAADAVPPPTDAPPPAAAFVTSFDLELEMSFLAKRVPFRLVMPFYVKSSGRDASGYVWLHTLINPPRGDEARTDEDLNLVRRPAEWSLLLNHSSARSDLRGVPVVVRLAGCPLIAVPDLSDKNAAWVAELLQAVGTKSQFAGTMLLDEHTALQQWAADFEMPAVVTDVNKRGARLGIHDDLVSEHRFWLLLGVQLNDNAVRHRTAALVGASNRKGGLLGKRTRSQLLRSGVVINRHSTASQRDVFLWQGLDVVQATFDEVITALNHAAAHAADPDHRRFPDEDCTLGSPA